VHRVAITSDVHQHILMVNKKAKEEWDQKQAEEAEKLKKQNEVISLGFILFYSFGYCIMTEKEIYF
jgi:hypothetical protein